MLPSNPSLRSITGLLLAVVCCCQLGCVSVPLENPQDGSGGPSRLRWPALPSWQHPKPSNSMHSPHRHPSDGLERSSEATPSGSLGPTAQRNQTRGAEGNPLRHGMPSSSNHNPHFVAPAVAGAPAVQPASFSSPQEEIDISAPNGPAVGAMPLQSALQNPNPLSMPPSANIPGGNNPYGTNPNAPHAQGYLQNSASIQGMHLQAQQRPASLVALELMERNKQLQYDLETLQRNNEALVNELNENNALMDQTRQQVTDYLQLIENQKNEIVRLSSALQRLQQESAGMKRQYEMEIKAVGDEVDKMLMQQILDK